MADSITERFDIKYGKETEKNYIKLFKESKLDETIIKDMQNSIGVTFATVQPFQELFPMIEYMKKYDAKFSRPGTYTYYVVLTMNEKSAKLLINIDDYHEKKPARNDIDDLEKKVREVLKK